MIALFAIGCAWCVALWVLATRETLKEGRRQRRAS